ncbi:vWA domain-containing protein [Algihabitans sp.]|uniref:vWA domain-containing protein n=1 Tax=Algihabitans sp. TaxID=2821514 RepID=UPI003BA9EBA7
MRQTDPFADAKRRLEAESKAEQFDLGELEKLPGGRLAENILYFARTLRAAGLPVGPGKTLAALEAVEAIGLLRRDDFYWTLHSVFVNRRDQQEIFDQAFHVFWRNPKFLERLRSLFLPDIALEGQEPEGRELSRRVAEALQSELPSQSESEGEEEEIEIDAALTYSDTEVLRHQDFEKMTAEEIAQARETIRRMRLPIMQVKTRRFRPTSGNGRADLRASLRAALRSGSDTIPLRFKRQRRRHPPLVILCDISGSMSRYSRMALHFMHAVTNDRDRVQSFVFGTRLSNITRYLRSADIDDALQACGEVVGDWSGGTRIGACLADFNRVWSRRVLGQGAVVLLITDGLDREGAEGLDAEMERLHKSCRRLIWLNPLLRYEGYEPKTMGAKAIMPHVDDFRSVHNLETLQQLTEVLSREPKRRHEGVGDWNARQNRASLAEAPG